MGFFHVLDADAEGGANQPGDYSKASTATVVAFLVRTGRWPDIAGGDPTGAAARLLDRVLQSDWTSAQLPDNNAFTVGFKLELAGALIDAGAAMGNAELALCDQKLSLLASHIRDGAGRVSIRQPELVLGEAPNSYLTQLVLRVLADWQRRGLHGDKKWLDDDEVSQAWNAAMASVNREVALLQADPLAADVFELGYALLIGGAFAPPDVRPTDRHLLRHGLAQFFGAQNADGSWPRGRRLFSYPRYGNAYCYDYEFLGQLLATLPESQLLLAFLPQLQLAVDRLTREAVGLPSGGIGWASGHHRQLHYPESWSTVSCFDVCHRLDRLVASAVTDAILQDLGEPRIALTSTASRVEFDQLLDAPVRRSATEERSLKEIIDERFLRPIAAQRTALEDGKPLEKGTALSAILYGPPGTSKTRYAQAISRAIGWELVTIDPSHLLRSGFDELVVELNRLFGMLGYAERVVVFFDEIDELVRTRSEETEEASSRFLTTSMLPRLHRLRESRRVVFLVATNHLEAFDAAIARPGRFDLVLPVMPPTTTEKLRYWRPVNDAIARLGVGDEPSLRSQIENLTFDEFASVAPSLADAVDPATFSAVLRDASSRGTLNQPAGSGLTWVGLMDDQRSKIRF